MTVNASNAASQLRFDKYVMPQVLGIQPYQPGKPVSELKRELGLNKVSKLASNENPLGASPKVHAAIQSELSEIGRYPDGSAYYLKQALSEFLQFPMSQIAVGNGSNELLELVARIFAGQGDEILYSQYAFAIYPLCAQIVGATGVEVPAKNWGHDLTAMAEAITPKTKLVYLANPNNPTGTAFFRHEWEAFMQKVPAHVIVMLDEAYAEYVEHPDYANGLDYLAKYPNLLVSRTFSKAYGLAALRVGYLVGCEEIVNYLNRVREPFNVNHYAQVAAIAALSDQVFVKRSVTLNKEGMAAITGFLEKTQRAYIPSYCNFVCVHFGDKAAEANQVLLSQGVIVRPIAQSGPLAEYLRVSIGNTSENTHFLSGLKALGAKL